MEALQGLKVLELGQLIAGPFAGKTLAEFGADVIKIESAGVVPKLSATPGRIAHAAPNLGQHDADLERGGGWPARRS